MMRPTKTDLQDLYEMAFYAAQRAEQQGKDYISVQNHKAHRLGLRIVASYQPGMCYACLMDWPRDTAFNLLYNMTYSWWVDFTPDDVDDFTGEVEGAAVEVTTL